MSAAATPGRLFLASPLAIGASCLIGLAVLGVYSPRGALLGWLIGFTILMGLSLGALALVCIGRLTGGRWAVAASTLLLRPVAAIPLLSVAFLLVVLGAYLIFPWVADPGAAGKDVASLYLNSGFFALRGAVALIGLSVVAVSLTRERGDRLLAAVGLLFYAFAVDFTSIDWMLSLSPRFSSSGFGVEIAIQNILSALAFTLLLLPASQWEVRGDFAGLALAAALGVAYMEVMALIVNWYGDQPTAAAWYLTRTAGPWAWVTFGMFVLGLVVPILALLFAPVRVSTEALRGVGAALLAGIVLHEVWLMAPTASPIAAPSALLAMGVLGGAATSFSAWMRTHRARGELSDGR